MTFKIYFNELFNKKVIEGFFSKRTDLYMQQYEILQM
jgi:hypothetical protein